MILYDMPPTRKPIKQKFAENTRREPCGCLIWTGKLDRNGYGLVSEKRQRWSFAHRVAWRVRHGDWPSGVLMHACDTPACVEVDHLSDVAPVDNVHDAIQKGRLDNRGSKHGMSKLTEDQAVEIRRRYAAGGVTQQQLADEYGLRQSTISMICSKRNWKHL